MNRYFILLVTLFAMLMVTGLFSAPISGTIVDSETGEPVTGAHIKVIDGQAGDVTGLNGEFSFDAGEMSYPIKLYVSHISYEPDTIEIFEDIDVEIALSATTIMGDEVVVEEVSTGSGKNAGGETIGKADIVTRRDAGASSLGDLLQGLAGANVQVCCALDSRAELRLLGLPGGYTEISLDGIPEVGGLASSYRLYSYPAIGITRMEVHKGASSAYSQAKALGGHLDIVTREPSGDIAEGSIAAYHRTVGGNELQGELATKIGGIGVASAFDMASGGAFDRDGDGWSESPGVERSFGRLRLTLDNSAGYSANLTGLYIRENRLGGMMGYDREVFGDGEHWIRSVITQRYEGNFNLDMPLAGGNLYLAGTAASVDLDQIVGDRQTVISENGAIVQGNWSKELYGTEFSAGAEYRVENIEDDSPGFEGRLDGTDDRISMIAEDEFYPAVPLTVKAGLRVDGDSEDNASRQWILFPRLSLKWDISDKLMALASYGSGGRFRPSVQNLLEGYDQSVSVVVPENLENERGHAVTLGTEWKEYFGTNILTLAGGGSYSNITRRIVPVSDDEGVLTYTNADGPTNVGSMHLQGSMEWARGITLQGGAEFNYTETTIDGNTSSLPFTPKWRGFGKFIWKDFVGVDGLKVWLNSTLFGPQDLPENSFGMSETDPFAINDVAATFRTGPISFTLGVWNVLDEVQTVSPLQGTADPFASGVSTELVYGPLVGRNYVASVVYHFGLPGDVLMGAGYGGLVEDEDESYAEADRDDHEGHGHEYSEVAANTQSPEGHVHGEDCDHGENSDSAPIHERPEPEVASSDHIHGEDCDHGHVEPDIDHAEAPKTLEANVWLIDDKGKRYTCPVMGNSGIVDDKTTYTIIGNKKYYHCCPSCQGEEKVQKALKDGFVVPGNAIDFDEDAGLKIKCPVMGNEAAVDEYTAYSDFAGKRYYFCCPPCKEDFDNFPEKYIAPEGDMN